MSNFGSLAGIGCAGDAEPREQAELHASLVRGDPTASARLFEAHCFSPLVERLTYRWKTLGRQELKDQATDSLIGYVSNPQRYDPQRASLLTYLTLDADGDLKNAYRSALDAIVNTPLATSQMPFLRGMRRRDLIPVEE